MKKTAYRGFGSGAALVAALVGTAIGAGPDVIVGDMPDFSHWTTTGAINGYRSYSVGTVSCNIGDENLQWVSSTNRHPVISGNIYRLANDRFEQIGQSWLKHGFTALNGTLCGSCLNPDGTGATLDPTCSDPYSSGLNGQQNRLGPKSEVNAFTGYYPYPYVNRGTGSGELFKRIQVLESDLTTPGARYFTASMYVAPDDAEAGNHYNNASYRPINVNTGNFNISLTGSTARTKPAIFAWKDHGLGLNQPDPAVIITQGDVPGDGRFFIGVKATSLGGGQWRYEYAVQNMHSDRSAGSFTIPLPPGAVVSNAGFRDVPYHSGEPYSGTDWTANVTGSGISWSTQTFAENANANALRWDTIYNFRFDCNVPPSGGQAIIGLFKPGAGNSLSITTVIPSPDGTSRPFNDDCVNATDVGAGLTTFSTAGATTDGPTQSGACAVSNYTQIGSDVWFRYTPTCTGTQTVSLCGSTFDTKVAVYANTCPTLPDSALACNDDFACGGNNLASQLSFTGTAGVPVLIRVGGFNAATGDVTMNITAPGCGPVPPANDACSNAQWAAAGIEYTGSTTLATNDGTASCGASGASPDVWFKYRPVTTGEVRIDTCTSSYDTVLSVHSACGGTQIACNDDSNGVSGAPCSSLSSFVRPTLTAGVTYWIRIAGYNGATGTYKLHINGGGGGVPPTNDDCANRAGIGLGTHDFTTAMATTDGPTHSECMFNGSNQITSDVWYNYPSLCDGILRVSTCTDTAWNTKIALYSGNNCTDLANRLLACSDDDCGQQTRVEIPVVNGDYVTIRIGGVNGASGAGRVTLECIPYCPADYNQDGGIDGGDVAAFYIDWEAGSSAADFNQDGGVDGADVDAFFAAWESGSCD
ncbi:MAG: hypothetical protein JNK25_04760 [Phycisphaerae bacterium]|nr:hypothetical protein [Phycisphaerae bacterium]